MWARKDCVVKILLVLYCLGMFESCYALTLQLDIVPKLYVRVAVYGDESGVEISRENLEDINNFIESHADLPGYLDMHRVSLTLEDAKFILGVAQKKNISGLAFEYCAVEKIDSKETINFFLEASKSMPVQFVILDADLGLIDNSFLIHKKIYEVRGDVQNISSSDQITMKEIVFLLNQERSEQRSKYKGVEKKQQQIEVGEKQIERQQKEVMKQQQSDQKNRDEEWWISEQSSEQTEQRIRTDQFAAQSGQKMAQQERLKMQLELRRHEEQMLRQQEYMEKMRLEERERDARIEHEFQLKESRLRQQAQRADSWGGLQSSCLCLQTVEQQFCDGEVQVANGRLMQKNKYSAIQQ